jgi:hypothetical protein
MLVSRFNIWDTVTHRLLKLIVNTVNVDKLSREVDRKLCNFSNGGRGSNSV